MDRLLIEGIHLVQKNSVSSVKLLFSKKIRLACATNPITLFLKVCVCASSISSCGKWGARVEIQVLRRELHTYIHLCGVWYRGIYITLGIQISRNVIAYNLDA